MYQLKKMSKMKQAGAATLAEIMLVILVIGVAIGLAILLGTTALSDQNTDTAMDTTAGTYSAVTDYAFDNNYTTTGVGSNLWDTLVNNGYVQANYLVGCQLATNGTYTSCTKQSPWGGNITFTNLPAATPYTGIVLNMPVDTLANCNKLFVKFTKQDSSQAKNSTGPAKCVGTAAPYTFKYIVAGTGTL